MYKTILFAGWFAVIALSAPTRGAPEDLAARGLDLFIHAPAEAPSGAVLPLQVRVFGFPTVATLVPLAKATVEATWDPESLGNTAAPPPVSITCDDSGRGHLDVRVPPGKGDLKLLVAARVAGHERTRILDVKRSARYQLDLRASDTSVVPGGAVSAWVVMWDRVTGGPAAGETVDLALKEGSYARFARRLVTDRSGTASAEVRVPMTDDPDQRWTLSARTAVGRGDEAGASVMLSVREETPQAPALKARWTRPAIAPGTPASFAIEVRDATGQGIAGVPVRTWVGPKGSTAPADDKAWQAASREARTDVDGNASMTVDTPRTVSPRGSSMTLVAKTLVDGHPLEARDTLTLAAPVPEVEISPELGVLVPGLRQRLLLRATLDAKPIAAELVLDGHDLHARVRTDPRGRGEASWQVPADVGAKVPDGAATDCAGEVAATVHVRWVSSGGVPAVQSFDRCLRVDRDAVAVVRPDRPLATAGETLTVRILGAKGSASLVLDGDGSKPWHSAWLADAARGGSISIPPTARGEWSLTAAGLPLGKDQHVLGTRVLVLPQVIPRLAARLGGDDRAAPGGSVTIEATLDDGRGRPLAGNVGAVVFDKYGGAHPERLLAMDTRHNLVAGTGIDDNDVDAYLGGDPAFDIARWTALASETRSETRPAFDPAANVKESIEASFCAIVQSLEGAVFESSSDPERMRDVRVRTASGFALNPEMLTLVTQAMSDTPVTPGGEPWTLADLMRIDPQVRFDNVARRVTRLKLFKVLSAVRTYLFDKKLDRDEPALRDPNAFLRRMVHDETIAAGDLLDPWGHGMSFVRSAGPRIPFISPMPGFHLVSAGPDGRFGTADDVRDPFQRVLASSTPYAKAVDEDRVVDARWDMRVGDETVEAWKSLLEAATGQTLGGQEVGEAYGVGGLGLGGSGTSGRGTGTLGRSSYGIDPGPARWLAPVRTDEHGHVRLRVPLGDEETTWQIVLVAMPDAGLPATTSVEVPTALPLSVRASTGARWTAGDEVEVALRVRNRTDRAIAALLRASASGSAALVDPSHANRTVIVPARSATTVYLGVRGVAAGTGVLEATVEGDGHTDRLRHAWPVGPAGQISMAENTTWIESRATLAIPSAIAPAQGPGRLVLEKGIEPALAAALDSFDPDGLAGARSLANALEAFARVHAWAVVRGGDKHPLAVRSRELARQTGERQELGSTHGNGSDFEAPLLARARYWEAIANPSESKAGPAHAGSQCPSAKSPPVDVGLDWLALAPQADRNAQSACWAALRASVLGGLAKESGPLTLARAVLVFLDEPAQAQVAAALAARLLAAVPVRPDGTLVLSDPLARDPAARSIVLAALARTSKWWPSDRQALAAKLWSKLYLERDVHGGYGSAEATRDVVTALLEADRAGSATAEVRYAELSDKGTVLVEGSAKLTDQATTAIEILPAAKAVRIESSSPGVLARAARPVFRSFFRPVDPTASPLHLDLAMSKPLARDGLASLQVTLRHEVGRPVPVTVRIPLPPGAALADRVENARQVQGAVYLRTELDGDSLPRVIEVPLRFTLAGKVTLPEATARVTDDEIAPARAPARPLVVLDR